MRRLALTLIAALAVAAAPAGAQAPAIPIPGPLDGPLPRYTGAPATAKRLPGPYPKANPALAGDGRSGSGLSAAGGGTSPFPGPLGRGTTSSSAFAQGGCSSLALDARDRVIAVCSNPLGPGLRLFDPVTLATLSTLALPTRNSADRTDLSGGTHFLVRADGTLLVPTHARTLLQVKVDGTALVQTGATDLGGLLAAGEKPFAVAAGYDGRDWVTGAAGTVITLPRDGGTPRRLSLGEPIAEDLATDPTGAYVVTRDALYRLVARADGTPRVVWRQPLESGLADAKAGRLHPGSGTPPVVIAGGYVAVVDAVAHPRVTVVRMQGRDARRLRCAVPVFTPGSGSVEAHLAVAGRSLVVSNAYGYENLLTTEGGRTTTGGLARIVVGKHGCRTAWTSDLVTPSAQAAVSRATGLLYTVEKPAGFPDAWNLVALDWRTGAKRFGVLAGEGLGYNSDGGAVLLAPDGAAYAGSFSGITRFADDPGA